MRLVLCENGLRDLQGHHFNIASEMKEELAGREIPLTILSHRSVEPSIRAALGAIPTFDTTPYDSLSPSFRGRQLQSFVRSAWRFGASLAQVEIGTDDVMLVLNARAAEILGLSIWGRRTSARPAAVVLNFMADDFLRARTKVPRWTMKLLYRLGFVLAREQFGSARLCLTSASGLLASSLTRLAGERVIVSPMLHAYPAARRAEDEICTIGFLGSPREDKGRRLLARVVQACALAHPDAQVVVQLPESFADRPPEGWPANVEELPVGLDRGAFWELVKRLDLAVLPYDLRTFGVMTSGVFADAVAAGAATVVPAGSWMASVIETGRAAGVTFDEFSVDGIGRAVARAVEDLDRLHAGATSAREAWRVEQGLPRYVDQLLCELSARGLIQRGSPEPAPHSADR